MTGCREDDEEEIDGLEVVLSHWDVRASVCAVPSELRVVTRPGNCSMSSSPKARRALLRLEEGRSLEIRVPTF